MKNYFQFVYNHLIEIKGKYWFFNIIFIFFIIIPQSRIHILLRYDSSEYSLNLDVTEIEKKIRNYGFVYNVKVKFED